MTDTNVRPLHAIALDIASTWKDKNGRSAINYGAVPYLSAMGSLVGIDDRYGMEDARSIVLYFLSNATTWRGEDARRIKAELKAMLKR